MSARASHLFPVYRPADLAFSHGEGAYLYAENGDRYLDFASGIAVTSLGHCHPKLVAALEAQARKLWHVSNVFRIEEQEKAADLLTSLTFADRVFFGNSGTEAIECAIKTARRYHYARGRTARNRFLAFPQAFHGRTLAALAAAGARGDMNGLGPAPEGFDMAADLSEEAVRAAAGEHTAAFLIEPIQGEGGVNVVSDDFLRFLRAYADEIGALVIFDEVQCGVGRTGKLYAHEWSGIAPDILASAKGLGGGFPVGACLATEAAASGMEPGLHGSTYGGNPLAMAVVAAVLSEVARPDFLAHVTAVGEALTGRLDQLTAQHPNIFAGQKGRGLMRGLQCRRPVADVAAEARRFGLLAPKARGDVLRLLPPLIATEEQMREAADKLSETANALARDAT